MLGLAVEGDSSMFVQGSNISRVAHFSSTLELAYVSIYGNDNSNVGYNIGVSNVHPNDPNFFIARLPTTHPDVSLNDSMISMGLDTKFASNIHVEGTTYTSNLIVYNSLQSKLLPAPARQSFFIDRTSMKNDFHLDQSGYYLSHSSNADIYQNGVKLRYLSDVVCDYLLSVHHNLDEHRTEYTVHLTEDANLGDIIDVVVWPYTSLSNESTLYQNITLPVSTTIQDTQWSSNLTQHSTYTNGSVGIGTSEPNYKLHVEGDIYTSTMFVQHLGQTSDVRTKTDVKKFENALDKIGELSGYTYISKTDYSQKTRIGVIAQEVNKVLPELVYLDKNGYMSVAYGNMAGVFIEAIKELKGMVTTLSERVETLETALQVTSSNRNSFSYE